jgi:hypothetical protein
MSANIDAMVREGINAYRAGKIDEARALLLKAVEFDERHEQAWLWLSAVVESPEDRQTCLENVLTINPHNENARQGLRKLAQQADNPGFSHATAAPRDSSGAPTITQLQDDDIFAEVSFTDPAPPAAPPAPAASASADEEIPADFDWAAPETSSASSYRPVNEPTPDELDDWVAGLNIGAGGQADDDFPPENKVFIDAPFIADLVGDDEGIFGIEDDSSLRPSTSTRPTPSVERSPGPFDIDDDDDVADPFSGIQKPAPAPVASAAPILSPVEEDDDLDVFDEDMDDFEFDDGESYTAIDPAEYFKSIPAEIQPTRMPGTVERYPLLLIVLLLLLVVLNAGAVYLLYITLSTP